VGELLDLVAIEIKEGPPVDMITILSSMVYSMIKVVFSLFWGI